MNNGERTLRDLVGIETDACVLWPLGGNGRGYGQVKVGKVKRITSNLACEIAHGPSNGRQAAHSCRSKLCVNPRHLRWATPLENQRDRYRDGTDVRGVQNGRAVLSNDDVQVIRKYRNASSRVMASWYGVHVTSVQRAKAGRTWGHI